MERIISVAWKRWRLIFTKELPRDCDGVCDPHAKKRKAIRIKNDLIGQDLLETFLHETHHAGNDSICEDYVERIAADQAAAFCHPDTLKRFLACPRIEAIAKKVLREP